MQKKIYNYAPNLDSETLEQFKSCYLEPYVVSAALMPDAHKGYVAPIGSVLITKKFIVPSWVGFDIGCGVIAVRIKGKNLVDSVRKKSSQIYTTVQKEIPMGLGEMNSEKKISEETKSSFSSLLENFKKKEFSKDILNLIKTSGMKHLGTLGGGNHFIELSHYKDELWLVIHSGSRGLGHKIASHYMKKASNSKTDYEKTFPLDSLSLLGKEYLNTLDFCLQFALLNRIEMSKRVILTIEKVLKTKLKSELWTNKNHNHAILEKGLFVHRKGATPSKKGERGVIPANMRDGSFLVSGLGNPKFLYSSSHGAGRAMSRSEASKNISLEEFKESMKGIEGTISLKTINEAPMAYKNIYEVMEAQKKSVKIVKHLLPIINWKG